MLARERKPSWAYATLPKDLAVVVEPAESVIEGGQQVLSDGVLACNITEI